MVKSIFAVYKTLQWNGVELPIQAFPTIELAQELCDYYNNPHGYPDVEYWSRPHYVVEIPFNTESLVPEKKNEIID